MRARGVRTDLHPCTYALLAGMTALAPVIGTAGARAQALPEQFRVAPEITADQTLLLQVTLNGLDHGTQAVKTDGDVLILPPETLRALHVQAAPGQSVRLKPGNGTRIKLDVAASTLVLDLPPSAFELQRFAPDAPRTPSVLSQESWGTFLNYDLNMRRPIAGASETHGDGTAFGGLADFHFLGPDLTGSSGWAYDSGQKSRPVRLDSVLSWRPASQELAVSVGDILSPGDSLALSRPYRFLGVQIGTDFSGAPGWTSATIPSIYGSAQAQSSLDLFINNQRAYSTNTPGGPFALTLPAGVGPGGASLVVTDVTGRAVVVPVEVPRVDAQVIRTGLFLWSAGLGLPRFGYGTTQSSYAADPDFYGTARYGAFENVTLRSEAEIGADIEHLEFGADAIVTPTLALRTTVAASHSTRGLGAAWRVAGSYIGPYGLSFDASFERSFGRFDDVVSTSGRDFARQNHFASAFTLPTEAEIVARVSWQVTERLNIATSYQASRFPQAGTVGVAALSINYALGNLPLFLNAFHSIGGRRSTSVVAGVSFQLGAAQGSVSGGSEIGGANGRSLAGDFNVAKPLRDEIGSTGWSAFGARSATTVVSSAQAEYRSGYGIPGIGVQSFGGVVTGLATARAASAMSATIHSSATR